MEIQYYLLQRFLLMFISNELRDEDYFKLLPNEFHKEAPTDDTENCFILVQAYLT